MYGSSDQDVIHENKDAASQQPETSASLSTPFTQAGVDVTNSSHALGDLVQDMGHLGLKLTTLHRWLQHFSSMPISHHGVAGTTLDSSGQGCYSITTID